MSSQVLERHILELLCNYHAVLLLVDLVYHGIETTPSLLYSLVRVVDLVTYIYPRCCLIKRSKRDFKAPASYLTIVVF